MAYLPQLHQLYSTSTPVEIHLEQCDILGHDGLLWVLAITQFRSPQERPTYVHLPTDPATLRFLKELRFPELVIDAGGVIANEYVLRGDSPDMSERIASHAYSLRLIQPITPATWPNIVRSLHRFFVEEVSELLGESPYNQLIAECSQPFQHSIRELILNAALHGGAEEGVGFGYACYRPWPRGYPLIRFCCADVGPGFMETLQRHSDIKCTHELQALQEALIYRHQFPEDGVLGLYNALSFVRLLSGRVLIRSRNASLFLDLSEPRTQQEFDSGYNTPSRQWVQRIVKSRVAPDVPGCSIVFDLSISQRGT